MRDRDDVPYIVIERESGGGLGSFVLGALVGAGIALLFAPQSGEETQEEIKSRAREFRDAAEGRVRAAQKQLEERLEVARHDLEGRVETVREAVAAGREAADSARSDLEERLERSKAAYRAGVAAAREVVNAPAGDGDEVEEED